VEPFVEGEEEDAIRQLGGSAGAGGVRGLWSVQEGEESEETETLLKLPMKNSPLNRVHTW
jgi:hypothetical protein